MTVGLGPLSISSTGTNVTVSWAVPQFPPNSYSLASACTLLCNATLLHHTVSTPGPADTSVNISGIFPGSVCNISLTGHDSRYNYLPTIASVTTQSESESLAKHQHSASSMPSFDSL